MKELILVVVGAALVNNIILSQFQGLCPFLGVSKKTDTAAGMGMAVIFVITLSSAVTSLIYSFVLVPLNVTYLQTIAFILVIAALVQFVEMFLKKSMPSLYQAARRSPSPNHDQLCSIRFRPDQRTERIQLHFQRI